MLLYVGIQLGRLTVLEPFRGGVVIWFFALRCKISLHFFCFMALLVLFLYRNTAIHRARVPCRFCCSTCLNDLILSRMFYYILVVLNKKYRIFCLGTILYSYLTRPATLNDTHTRTHTRANKEKDAALRRLKDADQGHDGVGLLLFHYMCPSRCRVVSYNLCMCAFTCLR